MKTFLTPLLSALGLTASAAPTQAEVAGLDDRMASTIVDTFYGALTASAPAIVEQRLNAVVDPAWRNCSSDDVCQDLAATIRRWGGRIDVVPELQWRRVAVLVADDQLVVRVEATGTPKATFLGLAPSGRSFRVMTIDIHTVRDGRIVETHHVEDWAGALRQLAPLPADGGAAR